MRLGSSYEDISVSIEKLELEVRRGNYDAPGESWADFITGCAWINTTIKCSFGLFQSRSLYERLDDVRALHNERVGDKRVA